jgi:hypothetical protein
VRDLFLGDLCDEVIVCWVWFGGLVVGWLAGWFVGFGWFDGRGLVEQGFCCESVTFVVL